MASAPAQRRTSPNGPDDFDLDTLIGLQGYVSSIDPTIADPRVMVRGSYNVYQKTSGTVANRCGVKRYDSATDSTIAKITSGFVWNTSLGATIVVRASNAKLQFSSSISGVQTWYTLLSGLTKERFVFDTYWDNTDKKDKLLGANGTAGTIYNWAGGIAKFVSANITAGAISQVSIDSAGSGYHANDVLSITGGGGTSGTATVLTVDSSGAIKTISLLAGGSGYATTTGASTSGGAGSGATISIVVTTGQIVLDRSAATSGFASSGSVVINGNVYTYTGISGSTLTGVGSDASAEPANSVVYSQIITTSSFSSGPTSTFNIDFFKVNNNQAYYCSYTSQLVYLSKNTDYTDCGFSSPRLTGEGDTILLDASATGVGQVDDTPAIFYGDSHLAQITFNQITVGSTLSEQTKVGKVFLGNNCAALAHEFIDQLAGYIVFLGQDQQLRTYGLFTNLFSAKPVILSQAVQDELAEQNFTGGQLRVQSDRRGDTVYINAPVEGKTFIYQQRSSLNPLGQVTTQRLWQPPMTWNITRVDSIGGEVVGFSNANPQIYYLWDTNQWHDDSPSGSLPYQSIMLLSYQNLDGRRQGKLEFDKIYWEGYMTENSYVYGGVYYDYEGATGLASIIINDNTSLLTNGDGHTSRQLFVGVQPPSLGDASLGDNPLGDGLNTFFDDQAMVPKFKCITGVQLQQCTEFALMIYSTNIDARWELLAVGTNMVLAAAQAVEFQK